jgi:hypothetical protein
MTYAAYYCFHCNTPSDEHRPSKCRNCGGELTPLVTKEHEE